MQALVRSTILAASVSVVKWAIGLENVVRSENSSLVNANTVTIRLQRFELSREESKRINDASTGQKHHFGSKCFCGKVGHRISECCKKQADEEKVKAVIKEMDSDDEQLELDFMGLDKGKV